MATSENFDLAHLGAVELFTPRFEESLRFFRDICAMREVARIGDSAYLRCWDEYQLYTLKLTASDTNGVGRTLYRASSPQALASLSGSGFECLALALAAFVASLGYLC